MKTISRIIIFLCVFTLTLIACARIPSAPPATPEARGTPPPEDTPYPYPVPMDSDAAQPLAEGEETILLPIITGPPASLPEEGPWMLVRAVEKLLLLSLENGTALDVGSDQYAGPPDLASTVSPTGKHLAFLTASDNQLHNLTLQIVTLPAAQTIHSIPLTSPETEPGSEAAPGEHGFDIARTIASLDNLAWSPDGRRLIFTGADDGPNADLYLMELDTGQFSRLSEEPSHAIRPRWSPDGQHLIFTGVNSLGTGAGFEMAGVWAVPLDGSEARRLDMPETSDDERHLGWAGPNIAIRYTYDARCGTNNLRAVNIQTGEVRIFWAGAFQGIGFDPASAKTLVSVAVLDETCNPGGTQGLILTHPEAQDALLVSERNALEITWSTEADQFLAATPEGVLAFDLFGRQTVLPGAFDRIPSMAPSGDSYVWAQMDFQGIPGIWFGETGTVPEQIYNGRASFPLWDPTNGQLLFFNNEGLYKIDFVNPPELIAAGFSASDAVIIQPE